ncbi:MAG: hypothetical protein AAB612_02335, partial [Patescibacteria group bacterium]
MPKFTLNIAEVLGIFLFFTVIFFSGYSLLCKKYSANDFDAQNFISWDYSAYTGAILYKDLLYYYGPLFFYKSIVPWVAVFYGLLTPLTLTGFYVIWKKIFNNRFFALVSVVALSIYIPLFIGEGAWNRYGTGAFAVTAIAYVFSLKIAKKNIIHVFLGVISGIVFSIIHDQGIYIGWTYFFLLCANLPIREGLQTLLTAKYYRFVLVHAFYYMIGFIAGFFPFALYLMYNNALADFFHALTEVSYAALFAKVPFLPYALSKDNLLIFVSIFLSVFVGMLVFLFGKVKKYASIFYVQLALTTYILILQQKNILRSMSQQLAIFCLILLMLLFVYAKVFFEQRHYRKTSILYFYVLLLMSFFIFIQPFSPKNILIQVRERFHSGFTEELKIFTQNDKVQQCQQSSFEIKQLPITKDDKAVYDFLQQEPYFNGRVFTFPADPIFYVMFRQIVTPYTTAYEASRLSAQQKNIEYIEKNNIQYVIYNSIGTDVDGVPVVLRANATFRYLFHSFDFYKQIGSFIILKKTAGPDFFTHTGNKEALPIINTLLTNNLRNIPYEEGQYKYQAFTTNVGVHEIFSGSIAELQTFLETVSVESGSTVAAVADPDSQQSSQENTTLRITADNGLITTMVFRSCDVSHPCLLNLQNLPLFFHNRKLVRI